MNHEKVQSIKKILIVDDDAGDRLFAKKILQKKYIVLEAEDGHEAINMAQTENPDLILMDIMMPKVDGYTCCHQLKTHPFTQDIPIVMLTGVGYELNLKIAKALGAYGFLTKPFKIQELLDIIACIAPVQVDIDRRISEIVSN